ncbi:DegV family protein [Ligilactobacillus ceti]|uniref:DegV family protein n=1 Tax=Ligilactobacillus ceti DSM 22408 TaxID=1122146 RepID=A0A0R2KHG5_9LACO|nr:DegV family protein [Ligilactobacillus ceti]KRN88783.1 DegV family protein [Ligilactobacillus ceti DSM 22408]
MTKKFKIVTDSSVLLTPEEITQYDIKIVPLTVELNGQTYRDGENISRADLLAALQNDQQPKTSQPALGSFVDTFTELTADGSPVIAIVLSDHLSGTYASAQMAAEMVAGDITIINSMNADRGLAFQVLAAAQDAQAGKSLAEIKAHLQDVHERTLTDVFVAQMGSLVASGRISNFAGHISKLLNIKLVTHLTDGKLSMIAKGRSNKTFYKRCQAIAEESKGREIAEIALSHVGCDEKYLTTLKEYLLSNQDPNTPCSTELTSSVIMSHVGLNGNGVTILYK